jgi:hypothetical protein
MTPRFYLPYLVNYSQPVAEDIIIFCVAMLTAILVSAEGQAFVATLLGDSRQGSKDRFHFNVFLHMSLLGTINFFVAGFGWTKEVDIEPKNFKKYPRLCLVLSRVSGPIANLLMANIAASLTWVIGKYGFEDKVFSTIAIVNITMAVYGLIMLPPLPGSGLLYALLPASGPWQKIGKVFKTVCPYFIVTTFLAVRLSGWQGISSFFNPIVAALANFILKV